jgi:hypothetical protein
MRLLLNESPGWTGGTSGSQEDSNPLDRPVKGLGLPVDRVDSRLPSCLKRCRHRRLAVVFQKLPQLVISDLCPEQLQTAECVIKVSLPIARDRLPSPANGLRHAGVLVGESSAGSTVKLQKHVLERFKRI